MRAWILWTCATAFACGGKQDSAECLFGQSSEACDSGGGGGGGMHEPPERHLERDLAACERDDPAACDHLYFHRARVPAMHKPAIAKGLNHGCDDLSSAMSCLHLAIASRDDRQLALARSMFERACTLGLELDTKEAVHVGCSEQAAHQWTGDPEAARALLGTACRHLTKDPSAPRPSRPCAELAKVSGCTSDVVGECSELGIKIANAQPH